MGGFGSGGSRSGAGRRRKPKHLRLLDGGAGRRGDDGGEPPIAGDDAPPSAPLPLEPPTWLGEAQLVVWHAWAPLAHAEGTLVQATLENFVQLCALETDRRELWARYQLQFDAKGQPRALLLMSAKEEMATRREHRTLAKDIHARMKDFKIAPFGKELASPGAGKADEDPLDQFTRRG